MIRAYSFQIDRMSIENNGPAVAGTTALPGSLLRKAREEKGLTIDEMSAISNLTKQVIRRIDPGKAVVPATAGSLFSIDIRSI